MSKLIDTNLFLSKEENGDRKLIDADAFIENVVNGLTIGTVHLSNVEKQLIVKQIQAQPTVDAVPVVRCKDCKHNSKNGGTCDHVCIDANDEWFCADGEKVT